MRTVEITRVGDAPVLDQLAEMRHWLRQSGIQAIALEAVSIINAQALFRGTFGTEEEAELFRRRFGAGGPG